MVISYLKKEEQKYQKELAYKLANRVVNTTSGNLDLIRAEAHVEKKPIIYFNKITEKYKVMFPKGVDETSGESKGFDTLAEAKEVVEEWYKRQYEAIQEIEEKKNIENAWKKVE